MQASKLRIRTAARMPLWILLCMGWVCVVAQNAPSRDLSQPNPSQAETTQKETTRTETTIRVGTSEVLVPTLVEGKGGKVVYGLGAPDFALFDNGKAQRLRVDEDLDTAPVSVVVALETGRTSMLEFDTVRRLGSLLDLFLGDQKSEVALVTFDSEPHLVCDFSGDAAPAKDALAHLAPGDGGAAILDTAGYGIQLLQDRPESHRRVLVLISETRDHGSRQVKEEELVKAVGTSNTLVVSLAYVPSRAEFLHDLKSNDGGSGMFNLMTPLMMAVQAMRKNTARELAEMSGGEYAPFMRERAFEERVVAVSRHARNRYLLSFQPTDRGEGLHALEVRVTAPGVERVVARSSYWALPPDAAKP